MIDDVVTLENALGYILGFVVTGLYAWMRKMNAYMMDLERRLPKEFVPRHEHDDLKNAHGDLKGAIERLETKIDAKLDRIHDLLLERKK